MTHEELVDRVARNIADQIGPSFDDAMKNKSEWVKLRGEKNGHGTKIARTVVAGAGMVDWTAVAAELDRIGFEGPLSIHCEFEAPAGEEFVPTAQREAAFFRRLLGRD